MNDNAKKWVAVLRSGEFKQGKNYLNRGDEFCCLGVACELYQREMNDLHIIDDEDQDCTYYDGNSESLPNPVREWLGLKSTNGQFNVEEMNRTLFITGLEGYTLAALNDEGCPFEKIADVIELEPEGLFLKTYESLRRKREGG